MSSSYFEISGADRMEIEDVLERLTLAEVKGALEEKLEELLEELREKRSLGKASTKREVIDAVVAELRRVLGGALLYELVNELGALGWELVSPARVRVLRARLEIYNRMTESLSRGKRSGRTRRPRVKKLKE
jgi:hypothetical protein